GNDLPDDGDDVEALRIELAILDRTPSTRSRRRGRLDVGTTCVELRCVAGHNYGHSLLDGMVSIIMERHKTADIPMRIGTGDEIVNVWILRKLAVGVSAW